MSLIQNFVSTVQSIGKIPELRRKLMITLLIAAHAEGGGFGRIFALANLVSGGSVLSFTLFSLGIMPYISASIIFQLLGKVVPTLEQLQKEGESGRRKITQWTRYATIGIALVQGFFMMTAVLNIAPQIKFTEMGTGSFIFVGLLSLTTGTVFLMWLGEKITEHGIGNGASLIITANIIAALPGGVWQVVQQVAAGSTSVMAIAALSVVFVLTVVGVVFITQGQRRIPIQQAKHTRGRRQFGGQRHYMPLRVNMAGVMPIIFASALLMFPQMIFNLEVFGGPNGALGRWINRTGGWPYCLAYAILTYFFSYFWNQLIFSPQEMANNMKEWGSFVPGIRPGKKTAAFLEKSMTRITLAGATFLAFIAIFPLILLDWTGIMLVIFLGGTSMLIAVGVALDVVQKIESHLLMRHYKGFLGGGGIRGRQ
ncbi:MAG: preprotein translocase subunit SecY [Planctomycetota bacterium]|jgi:preprotein translocase subunit SecY